jgi:hypothetical protein
MPILDRHSTASRRLILVMVVVETWPTIFPSAVIASV